MEILKKRILCCCDGRLFETMEAVEMFVEV